MNAPKAVYDLVLTLILSACLWGGFLNIIEKSGFMNMFSYILKPLLKLIYGSIINNKSIYNYLSLNVLSNLIGLGTLSCVSGIHAFKEMYNEKGYVCREMLTLVIFNSAGFTLYPASIIMLRKSMGSILLYEFYPYMIVISVVVLICGLIVQRVIDHE